MRAYTVTFDTQGGSEIEKQVVEEECYIEKPADPVKEGYTFIGWVDANGNAFNFDQAVTSDVTVVAEWKSENNSGCFNAVSGAECTAVLLLCSAMFLFRKKKEI